MSDLDRLKTHVTDAVEQMAEDLWSLALQIHANPELAFKEEKAAGWLTAFLERQGCRVERGVGGLGIHLVRGLANDLRYSRIDDHNVLRIRLNRTVT